MNKSAKNREPSPDQRLNVLLEDLRGQFRAFGEGLADVQEKVSKLPEMQERLKAVEQDVSLIKAVIPKIQEQLGHVEQDVSGIKSVIHTLATKKDLEQVKEDVTVIKSAVPTLATKRDLEKLEKRLTLLETH